jgi:outer membrane protein assembly factor BamB
MPSPVSAGGQLYALSSGFLSCFDARSGKLHFKERLEGTGVVVASPIAVGARLVLIGESGKGLVLAAKPTFEVVGGRELDDVFWATPTVAGEALILRGVEHLYCLRARTGG